MTVLRTDFLGILEDTVSLFLWNRESGMLYPDLSEESLGVIKRWADSKSKSAASIGNVCVKSGSGKSDRKPEHFCDKAGAAESSGIQCSYIFKDGDSGSGILFIGERFRYSDSAGELFINILKAMNLSKETVFLLTFAPLDYNLGISGLRQQVNRIREQTVECIDEIRTNTGRLNPKVICTLGDPALKVLMGREYMLTTSRGRLHDYNGISLMPTYHPLQIVSDTSLKRPVWEDMKQVMGIINRNN